MKWELYLDESGSFGPDEPCLIGGFLCPAGTMSKDIAKEWRFDVQQVSAVKTALGEKYWKFDHCSENVNISRQDRNAIQAAVLNAYTDKIRAVGGKLVVFDNRSGSSNIDNTTTYLTVLAKGLMMLFADLQQKSPVKSLRVHPAERRNITQKEDPSALAVSPTSVSLSGGMDQKVILDKQYANQIQNLAFLAGGSWLLDDAVFKDMIEHIEIIPDDRIQAANRNTGAQDKQPHPITIPCDYICNTFFYRLRNGGYADILSAEDVLYYRVDRPMDINSPRRVDGDLGSGLLQWISDDFTEPFCSRFLKRMNAECKEAQRSAVQYAANQLRLQVNSQKNMEQLIERFQHAVEAAARWSDDEIRSEFAVNLKLYQLAMYTHLGNQQKIQALSQESRALIDRIDDDSVAETLLDIVDNRELVALTDLFAFEAAEEKFKEIEADWRQRIDRASGRRNRTVQYPVYGRIIGSMLQTLRHKMHTTADDVEREVWFFDAEKLYGEALKHLKEAKDVSRIHQTFCDIAAEHGDDELAFGHLFLAACGGTGAEEAEKIVPSLERAKAILDRCGYDGTKDPYLMQHYIRLLAAMYEKEKTSFVAETMAEALKPAIGNQLGAGIYAPHPRTQIQWKTASFLLNRSESSASERAVARELYKNAVKSLLEENSQTFSAIAVGVLAEQAAQICRKHTEGNLSTVLKDMQKAYGQLVRLSANHPQHPVVEKLRGKAFTREEMTLPLLEETAKLIGY